MKVGTSEASYPLCVAINKGSVNEGFAVGLLNKTVKFFTIDSNQSNNPMNWEYSQLEQTSIENFKPSFIEFYNDLAFISYDDCTKVVSFGFDHFNNRIGDKKPKVLDIIQKPYGKVLDFKFAHDHSQLYLIDYV